MAPDDPLPGDREIIETAERLRGRVHRTPLLTSSTIAERSGAARVLLKCENLQRSGSFKVRGALNACLRSLERGEVDRGGFLTYSSGNHGQAVALAARLLEREATIVVPEDIPRVKETAIRAYGARLVKCGRTSLERRAKAEEIERETGATMIPPFDHFDVIAGQATVGREILEDAGTLDAILVPVGGGGLIAGIALAAQSSPSPPRVLGVEPATANALQRSLEAGRRVTLERPPRTIADGLCPVTTGELTLRAAERHVAGVITVEDDLIREAQHLLLERAKLVVEPSGAAAVAALLTRPDEIRGASVAVVLSGGNVAVPPL